MKEWKRSSTTTEINPEMSKELGIEEGGASSP
jgi:hypothetical protein